jgi:hypothetical protein
MSVVSALAFIFATCFCCYLRKLFSKKRAAKEQKPKNGVDLKVGKRLA